MKILITGGAGYVGYALANILANNEDVAQIILYDNLSRNNHHVFLHPVQHPEKFKLIRADILDSEKLKQHIKNIDVIYHLAAKVSTPFANQDPHFFEQINHWGTAELVYAVEESDVKQFIYLSSISIYDRSQEEINELSFPNPHTYYGISKLRGEEHVRRLVNKMKTYIIRCGNVYGYGKSLRFDAVINQFMLQANFGGKISIQGSGDQSRAFIHIDKAVDVLAQIPFKELPASTYNLVTKNLSVNAIAGAITKIYPGTDQIYMNQNMQMASIQVNTNCRIFDFIPSADSTLIDELSDFKSKFAF